MYSPLLKESVLLPIPLSYFLYLFVQWTKEKKRNTFVLCFEKEHSKTKQMVANTGRGNGYASIRVGLELLNIFAEICSSYINLIFFGFFGCQTFNAAYLFISHLACRWYA
jgi:hypothetical protein